ncbi:TetR/AcrR family transcriptional regulator [Agromyces binzhouensis]|uniref:TetR/AcrR family transcriptional regulator n=1 Tax=Agromyces binzhouensis TaxID=1817495 RepID=UPI0036330F4D
MRRTAGQRAGLTRQQVTDAAMELLRAEGLDAVSMRRVAERLGVAPNSIYAHVADKAALVDELIDAMLGGVATPTDDGWRARIERVMRDSRRELLVHPDLVPFALVRQSVGPNALRLGEITLGALREAGLDGAAAVTGLQVLLVHTIGSAAFETGRTQDPDPAARGRRGRERAAEFGGVTAELSEPISRWSGDEVFERGLGWLLDGLVSGAADGR